MKPIQRILIATDFSPRAQRAAERATLLAEEHRSTLHLAHAVVRYSAGAVPRSWRAAIGEPEVEERGLAAARADMRAVRETLKASDDLDIVEHVNAGSPAIEIDNLAQHLAVDLVVVGAHGRGFLREALFGTTAFRLLQRCAVPVLAVKSDRIERYRKVLVAVDFSESSEVALKFGLRIAPGADFTALHVVHIPFDGRLALLAGPPRDPAFWQDQAVADGQRELDEFVRGATVRGDIACSVRYGQAWHTILDCAGEIGADLIVVGCQGWTRLEGWLGSVTKHVAEGCGCDLLVTPPSPRTQR